MATIISCEVLRAGARMPDARVGSKAQVLNVKSWDPAQSEAEVPHGHSVELNIEALNTAEKDIHYDEGADFLTGSFSGVQVVGDELNLLTAPFDEDWEGVTPLNDWTQRFTTGNFSIIDDGTGNKVLRGTVFNQEGCRTADNGPNGSDVEVRTRYQFKDTDKLCGVVARITGSGSSCRGYEMLTTYGGNYVQLRRITGDGSTFGLGTQNLGVNHSIDTWYWIAYKVVGSNHYAKWWVDGSAEPGTWTWIASNSTHPGPGDCGVFYDCGVGVEVFWFDDFSAEQIPPVYQASGWWESDDIDVSSVDHYSHGQVSWDQVTPTDTTAAVKYRWRDIDSWATLNNGAIIPGIEYEQDMRAGATKDTLELRVELGTTDGSVTPAVSNLRVYFEPARDEEFKLIVHGYENVIADQTLAVWGRSWLRSGSGQPYIEDPDWSDIFASAMSRWMARDFQTVTASFTYWGNAIDSITFEAEASKYRHGFGTAEWVVPALARESGLTVFEWTVLEEWFPMGHNYEWSLIDKGQAIHADAKWICGHIQIDNLPGSLLVGLLVIDDQPGSLLVEGYKLTHNPGMLLVQGPRIDNQPGMVLPAVQYFYDNPGSLIVGVREIHNQPGMLLVYGVNREGSIFVNVIDDNTYQTLIDFGVTFS